VGRGPTKRAWLLELRHLKDNNETYTSHMLFAGRIGLALLFRGLVFIGHAILPVCNIPTRFNLDDTLERVYIWSVHANKRKRKNQSNAKQC